MGRRTTERPWFWYAGRNDEACQVGPCKSRDEALAEALSSDVYMEIEPDTEHPQWRVSIYLVEATKHDLSDIRIDAALVLERIEEYDCEEWLDPDGDGHIFDATPEQVRDLSLRLTDALKKWAKDHDLTANSWCFRDTRNDEWVTLPHPDIEKGEDNAR